MSPQCEPAVRPSLPSDMAGAVVVAVDGSRASLAAVEWAGREALTLGRQLRLVNVIGWPYDGGGPGGTDAVTLSAEVLAEAAAHARSTGAGADVVTESIWGRLGPLLVGLARHAHTVVLGRRDGIGFAGTVLSSCGLAVATQATGPVVVVPEPTPGGWLPAPELVVAGVDGSQSGAAAVVYAFDYAARHGFRVEAVTAGRHAATESGTEGLLREVSASFPTVSWRERHPVAAPVEVLSAAAGAAALLVVGCRSRLEKSSPLVDSVSRGVIFLARCPVAVV